MRGTTITLTVWNPLWLFRMAKVRPQVIRNVFGRSAIRVSPEWRGKVVTTGPDD